MPAMRALIVASLLAIGCGGRLGLELPLDIDGDAATSDTSSTTDSVAIDSRPIAEDSRPPREDTRPPMPTTCESPLDPSFKCTPPAPVAGKKVCTDAAIRELSDGCFGYDATEGKCNAAMKKYAGCGNCMLYDWIDDNRLAIGACIQKVAPGDKCATAIECTYDCLSEVCAACDTEPGSGKGGGSEADDCWETAAEGQCYPIAAKDYGVCVGDPKLAVCIPNTVEDLLPFYRGACRDGGDWSKANIPDAPSVDAGAGG